jgi:cytochrome c peroxidase
MNKLQKQFLFASMIGILTISCTTNIKTEQGTSVMNKDDTTNLQANQVNGKTKHKPSKHGPSVSQKDVKTFLRTSSVPVPKDNQITEARIELGKMLFFDPRLSGSNWISCATCHNPAMGWSDGLPTGIGHGMEVLGRATPTILNTAYQKLQFWDGRARTLEEQALGPMSAPGEMNQDLDELVKELAVIPGYVTSFEKAYSKEGITKITIAKAIATFERTIVSSESPFDSWLKGDGSKIQAAAKRGFETFKGKANCAACHHGFNFSDDGFHNIGLKGVTDVGRYAIKPVKVLKGAFKTPTLRDIAFTAPYMHNGMYKTLEEVVDHYDRGGDLKIKVDPNMKKLDLSKQEKRDLVAFLQSLSGKPVVVSIPKLP